MSRSSQQEVVVPAEVLEYIKKLDKALRSVDVTSEDEDIRTLYERSFKEVSEKCGYGYEPNVKPPVYRPWPWCDAESIKKLVAEAKIHPDTMTLYKFLCCKHLFVDRNVSAQSAARAWECFGEATAMLLKPAASSHLINGIVWDIFDEFVYQLSQVYNRRLTRKKELHNLWSIAAVYEKLSMIVEKSSVLSALERVTEGHGNVTADAILGSTKKQAAAGLFAMITQMRVDVLLGDYTTALARLQPLCLPVHGRALFTGVEGAAPVHIATYYQVGFCYLMLHRYVDAAANFRACLSVKASSRRFSDRLQADAAALYSVVCVLGGLHAEDVGNYLDERNRQNFDDEVRQLNAGQHEKFREVFSRCSPKFITIPIGTAFIEGIAQEAKELQTRMFMRDVMQQLHTITLRGYFHVYRTISAEKINSLVSAEKSTEELNGNDALVSMKYKSKQLVHDGKSPDLLSGSYKSIASIGLVIDVTSVHVIHTGVTEPLEISYANRIDQVMKRIAKKAAPK